MKKRMSLLTCFCMMMFAAMSQENARNGYVFPPNGTIRILVVFADVEGDPHSNDYVVGWPAGQLPRYKDSIVDVVFSNSMVSDISRFYQQSSFGTLQVIGDYYPELVKVPYANVNNYSKYGAKKVAEYLDNQSGAILTNSVLPLSAFDNWTLNSAYRPQTQDTDDSIDVLAIVWRHNSIFSENREKGQTYRHRAWPIKNMAGLNALMNICCDKVSGCMRHEFAHELLGENEFHSGGAGAGEGHFISNIGGYSILGSFNKNLYSCNGWDRWRLGWKHPLNQYYISARRPGDMSEVEADFVYGEQLEENEFVLRDFVTYGDAIRIKLPYVKSIRPDADNQYLWIENHQLRQGTEEYDLAKPKGIRFNIQIGNDNLDSPDNPESLTNYLVPLSAFGNYDFEYYFDPANVNLNPDVNEIYTARTTSRMENPFAGHHLLMLPAIDFNPVDGEIYSKEYPTVLEVIYNGTKILDHHPVFGNRYDAFPVGSSLRMASNPPSTPLLTYTTKYRNGSGLNPPNTDERDNRHIFLNGLRVDILEGNVDNEGAVRVRIRWDDYDVDRDERWCDSVILTENVVLNPYRTVVIDQGHTPVQPHSPFVDPTVFTCLAGSMFEQKDSSAVYVENESALILEPGSIYKVGDNASLNIRSGSTLVIREGATLVVVGRGHVEIEPSAYLCVEDGAFIQLVHEKSVINFHNDAYTGLGPSVVLEEGDCTLLHLGSYPYIGYGQISNQHSDNYIQNRTFYGWNYEVGETIYAGHHVTDLVSPGNVIIEASADVVIDADYDVYLEPGVEVKLGGALEVR